MRRGSTRILGGLLLLACTSVYVFAAVMFYSMRTATPDQMVTPDQMAGLLIQLTAFAAFPVVGSLIVTQRPSNTVGWIFCAIGLGTAFTSFSAGYVQHALTTHADSQVAVGLIDAVGSAVWLLNLGLGSLLLALFPNGKPLLGPWRVVVWANVAAVAAVVLASLMQPGPLEANGRVVNPLGIQALGPLLAVINAVGHLLFIPLVLAAVASVIVRYRRAAGVQRQQIKWFAYGAGAMALVIFVTVVASDALTPSGQDASNSVLSDVGFALAFVMLPVGAGIGVLRYRLYDIDALINRTLVYGSLTAALGLVYAVSILLLQRVLRLGDGSQLAIVASTLLIAALFSPLRARLQRFIDRQFYRGRYDAAKTLAAFGVVLRQEVNLPALEGRLLAAVEETMRPAHVSLWLQAPPVETRAGTPARGGAR